jgi:glycosyltransferase involved in cell wall biosynthesis
MNNTDYNRIPDISIVTPCFNEEGNVEELIKRVERVFSKIGILNYEHIFIDNDSTDQTQNILRRIASTNPKIKVIINNRNFGHIRSPYYGLLQASGKAAILLVADLQDPPEMIEDMIREWRAGYKVVLGIKTESEESSLMFAIRKTYYEFVARVSDTKLTKNNTGFGLYDRSVLEELKKLQDAYPYFRGLISELGYKAAHLPYHQPTRKRGITSNNFYKLYDIAMLGITSHSKVPLRLATMAGFAMSVISFSAGFIYLIYKLLFWNSFQVGMAPLLIGLFFFMSILLFFIGIIGEYVGFIHTQVMNRPLVTEKERINF